MKCSNCKKENPAEAKFCKYCATALGSWNVTCPNGHNYDAALGDCPHCPPPNSVGINKTPPPPRPQKNVPAIDPTVNSEFPTVKTNLDPQNNFAIPVQDRTKILQGNSAPFNNPVPQDDHTKILRPDDPASNPNQMSPTAPMSINRDRKLIGWLVTFDLNPNGQDYRIFEGKTSVGRSTKNDVILSSNFVSDKHATLRYLAGALEIMDDFSTSGTFVNDELIKDRIELKNDDRIKIGNINLRVKLI